MKASTLERHDLIGIGPRTKTLSRFVTALAACGVLALFPASAFAGRGRLFTGTFGGATSNVANPYPLGEAWSIAVDSSNGSSSGDVYIADRRYHRVEKFDSTGHFVLMFGAGVVAAGAEGVGDITAGSDEVTSVATSERAFQLGQEITGAGIPAGTRIVGVGVGTLTLSGAATISGSKVALTVPEGAGNVANNELQKVTLEHAPKGGSFRLTLTSATVRANVAAGSNQVTATREASGLLHVGDATNIISAHGRYGLVAGSSTISKVAGVEPEGVFAVGQPVEGIGIPAGTTIVAVGSETLTLSAAVTASRTNEGITARTKVAAVDRSAGSFTLSAASLYGESLPVVATETTAAIPYNATAGEVQEALESLAGVGAGNVAVSGSGGGPWTIEFKGPLLSDTDVPQLTVDATTLTGGEAGANVSTLVTGHGEAEVCQSDCQPGSEGAGPGAFTGEMFVAVDSSSGPSAGDVYVGDVIKDGREKDGLPPVSPEGVEGEGVVAKFDAQGGLVAGWGSGGQMRSSGAAPLGAVHGVAVDSAGDLWIDGTAPKEKGVCCGHQAFDPAGRVFEVRQDGTHVRDWSVNTNTGSLAVDGEEHVYLEQRESKVYKYTATGEEVGLVTTGRHTVSGAFAFDPSNGSLFQGAGPLGGHVLYRYEATCQSGLLSAGCEPVETYTSPHFSSPPSKSGDLAVAPESMLDTLYDGSGGEVAMFSVETLPDVVTLPASGFTSASATLNGSVDPDGVAIEQCYFEWGEGEGEGFEHTAPCESPGAAEVGGGSAPVAVHANITVRSGGIYRFRLVAANGDQLYEPTVGSALVFGPPRIDSTSVAQVTTESASLQAQIDPRNLASEYHFEYLTEAEYQENGESFSGPHTAIAVPVPDGVLGAGEIDLSASEHIRGLAAHTAYRYRVVAESPLARGAQAVDGPVESFSTWGYGSFGLPDTRQWELVSPPNKHGALVEPIGEDWVIQAAAQGGRLAFATRAPTEADPSGYLIYQSVLATRSPGGGWSSHDLALPHGQATDLSVGEGWEYRYFSEDLSRAIVQPFGAFVPCKNAGGESQPCLSPQATEQTAFLQDLSTNALTPLVTGAEGIADVPAGTKFGRFSTFGHECPPTLFCGPTFLYATPDAKHTLLESWTPLTGSPAPGKPIPADSLYEWSEGAPPSEQLRLISVLPGNEKGEALPAQGQLVLGIHNQSIRNAVSPDGELVVFASEIATATAQEDHLYLREHAAKAQSALGSKGECLEAQAACTVQLDTGLTGEAHFQTASEDLGHVFFSDGGDLYEYDVGEGKLVRMTSGAEVLGAAIGASRDGSYVYFVGNGAIAPGAAAGRCEAAPLESASCNLYVIHRVEGGWEAPKLIAVLGGADYEDWGTNQFEALNDLAARVSPDGNWLAFVSHRGLTGYDNRDAGSGERDLEVYEYEAAGETLDCVSCNPTGSRPHGLASEQIDSGKGGVAGGDGKLSGWVAGNVPGWTPNTLSGSIYQSRYLDDSGRLFFDSSDALVAKDINGTEDVYEYEPEGVPAGPRGCSSGSASGSVSFRTARETEVQGRKVAESPGCVGLISSGESPQESAFLDASEDGGEVFFLTTDKLVGEDVDTSYDVYDARECSSASPCAVASAVPPPPCGSESSCRPAPTPQPEIFGASGSATFSGAGNLEQAARPVAGKRVKARKLSPALKRCRRDKSRRKRARCEASARKGTPGKTTKRAGSASGRRSRAHSSNRRAAR